MPLPENEGVSSPLNSEGLPTLPTAGENVPRRAHTPVNGISGNHHTPEKPSFLSQVLTWVLTTIATAFATIGTTCGGRQLANHFGTWGEDGSNVTMSPDRWIIMGFIVLFIGIVLGASIAIFWIASRIWDKAVAEANKVNIEKLRLSGVPDK